MKKHHREIISTVRGWGATDVHIEHGNQKHPRVVFTWRGQRLEKTLTTSPRSVDASKNLALQDIRRMIAKATADASGQVVA